MSSSHYDGRDRDRDRDRDRSHTVDGSTTSSGSNSGNNTRSVSSPIHSLRKKGNVVRQSIEEFFTHVSGALSELNTSGSTTTPTPPASHQDSPDISPRLRSTSASTSPQPFTTVPQTIQRSNSNRQLMQSNSSSPTSSSSSPQSSNRSSVASANHIKSLAKLYFCAQQIDYVYSGSSVMMKPAPSQTDLPYENLSSILNVQWTTSWTIHLIPSMTCLDVLKYISQKTSRNVNLLKLADSEGKILEHDYHPINHRSRKFVVFEDINIESLSGATGGNRGANNNNNSVATGHGRGNNIFDNKYSEPSSPVIVTTPMTAPVSCNVLDDNLSLSAKNSPMSGSPTGQRRVPPPPPPRTNMFYNPLLVNTDLLNDPSNGSSGTNHDSRRSSPSPSRKNSAGNLNSSSGSPTQTSTSTSSTSSTTTTSSTTSSAASTTTASVSSTISSAATGTYTYCKFLDRVESASNPPTTEKGKILDNYFSHYYQELFKYIHHRSRRYQRVLDFVRDSGLDESAAQAWRAKHFDSESNFLRNKRAGMKLKEFKILTQIGKGGFGQVFLAIKNDSGDVVTLKRIKKQAYQWANQRSQVSQEKIVMSEGSGKWITRLLYSFQDPQYLYLAMEYHCGGDFRALLNNLGMLSEEDARFYMAEMVEALCSLHALNFIHRDIKPSNFVIDKNGHIKLIDFGLSKEGVECKNGLNQKSMSDFRKSFLEGTFSQRSTLTRSSNGTVVAYRRPTAHSAVGSPEYMAPEIVVDEGYTLSCDFWSLGCVFMEILCGFNPFCADTPSDVFLNIIKWREVLDWPLFTQDLSPDAADILKRMLCEPSSRFSSIEEFKAHPFFNRNGVTWQSTLDQTPPFIPKVESDIDTSYFEDAVNTDPSTWDTTVENGEGGTDRRDPFSNLNIPFFTYRKSSVLNLIDDMTGQPKSEFPY
ncbi:hypothetical protein SAMD00019534_013390 [Acytostelium subglobosum LB1]|uniref:hypothetical protein n=1 Tax=Acytostelium subglobosum LB1 TaxID=1410327 RepID=UPI0006449A72|nr:hypothetical protein SAMD00019534_013390 [Acytostelium subglobosum LB1]GAM18164.1 hypothetical protein SAMD00019534_013390 [Acytostelium subglobosum LB1]|eukprot:XP_012758760.1 hypothetical protein SAMD00019534_013390 [Acytostelium subglobosum LB1]